MEFGVVVEFVVQWGAVVLLVCLSGLFSGLTLGLLSLDKIGLEVRLVSSSPCNCLQDFNFQRSSQRKQVRQTNIPFTKKRESSTLHTAAWQCGGQRAAVNFAGGCNFRWVLSNYHILCIHFFVPLMKTHHARQMIGTGLIVWIVLLQKIMAVPHRDIRSFLRSELWTLTPKPAPRRNLTLSPQGFLGFLYRLLWLWCLERSYLNPFALDMGWV